MDTFPAPARADIAAGLGTPADPHEAVATNPAVHEAPQNDAATPLAVGPRGAAELLGVSHQTVYELLKSGRLRSVRAGRRRLIPMSALKEFLDGAA